MVSHTGHQLLLALICMWLENTMRRKNHMVFEHFYIYLIFIKLLDNFTFSFSYIKKNIN